MRIKKVILLSFVLSLSFFKNVFSSSNEFIDEQNGVTLDYLIENGVKNNKIIDVNNQNKLISEANIIQNGLYINPNLQIEYSNSLDKNNEYNLNFQYSHPFEFFGKRNSILKVSQIELENTINDIEYKKQLFVWDIKTLYINTILDIENLKVNEEIYNLSKKILKVNELKFKSGDISKYDLNVIKIENKRLENQIVILENEIKNSLEKLKFIIIYNNNKFKLKSKFYNCNIKKLSEEKLYSIAIKNRYDFKSLELNKNLYKAKIEKYTKEYIPNINLISSFQAQKSDKQLNMFSLGLSSDLPIYNRNQGFLLEIESLNNQNDFKYKLLENELKNDININLNTLNTLEQSISYYEKEIIPNSKDNIKIIKKSFELGDIDILQYILEKNRVLEVQKEYINYLKQYNLSIIAIEKLTGVIDIMKN